MSQLVKLEGVRVKRVANGEYTDLYLYDDNAEIYAYRLTLDATAFPDGSKVNAIAVMSKYNDKLQLRTLAENVTAASAAAVDKSVYEEKVVDGFKLNLANNWIYSVNEENYIDNRPNPVAHLDNTGFTRQVDQQLNTTAYAKVNILPELNVLFPVPYSNSFLKPSLFRVSLRTENNALTFNSGKILTLA